MFDAHASAYSADFPKRCRVDASMLAGCSVFYDESVGDEEEEEGEIVDGEDLKPQLDVEDECVVDDDIDTQSSWLLSRAEDEWVARWLLDEYLADDLEAACEDLAAAYDDECAVWK